MAEDFEYIIDSKDSRNCCSRCGEDAGIGTHHLYITNKDRKLCGGCKGKEGLQDRSGYGRGINKKVNKNDKCR